jgi:hypothetical protein
VRIASRKAGRHTNDGDIVLGSLELPERNVDGDTTLTLGLQFVEDPCVLEGTLTELGGFLRLVSMLQPKWENCMCVMVLQFAKAACGLALARKSSHNPTNPKMPLITISQKRPRAQRVHRRVANVRVKG